METAGRSHAPPTFLLAPDVASTKCDQPRKPASHNRPGQLYKCDRRGRLLAAPRMGCTASAVAAEPGPSEIVLQNEHSHFQTIRSTGPCRVHSRCNERACPSAQVALTARPEVLT